MQRYSPDHAVSHRQPGDDPTSLHAIILGTQALPPTLPQFLHGVNVLDLIVVPLVAAEETRGALVGPGTLRKGQRGWPETLNTGPQTRA